MELERTPIYEIFDRKQSGNQLYIMREDLLPFSLGGNKVQMFQKKDSLLYDLFI